MCDRCPHFTAELHDFNHGSYPDPTDVRVSPTALDLLLPSRHYAVTPPPTMRMLSTQPSSSSRIVLTNRAQSPTAEQTPPDSPHTVVSFDE